MIVPLLLLIAAPIVIDGCADAEEIRRIAELERTSDLGAATVSCRGDLATIQIGPRTRIIDLTPVDRRARPRLLALTLAELSANEIVLSLAEPTPERDPGPAYAALVTAGFTRFTADSPFAIGARASFDVLTRSHFGGRIDLDAAYGQGQVPLGSASLLLVSAGLAAIGRVDLGALDLDVALGGRLGLARLRGTPRDPALALGGTVSGAWGGPFVGTQLSLPLDAIAFSLGLETGLVLRPVVGRAADRPVIAADGAWIALHAGIGFGSRHPR